MNDENLDDLSLPSLVRRLIGETRDWTKAELRFYRKFAFARISELKQAAILGIAGAVLGLAGLIAMLVGCILALATLVGPLLSTIIVVGVTFAIAALLVRAAIRNAKRTSHRRVHRREL